MAKAAEDVAEIRGAEEASGQVVVVVPDVFNKPLRRGMANVFRQHIKLESNSRKRNGFSISLAEKSVQDIFIQD